MYGTGAFSDSVSILAAATPTQMSPVTTSDSGTNVVFEWTSPSDSRGAGITAYRVKLLNKSTGAYLEDKTL